MTMTAQAVIDVCRAIAALSENPANLTRTYLSPPTRHVHNLLQGWMRRLGMDSRVDAVGNLRGVWRGREPNAPRLLLGSHIDTVPDAGAFDGVLGVILTLALIENLDGHRSDYDVEVVAFSEEEGVRFGFPFIGSRALIGDLDDSLLRRTDSSGVTLAEAIENFGLNSSELALERVHPDTVGFVEFHIEQGPVLEERNARLGIVEAVCGQSRYELAFHGRANHAGTTPMHLRHDALACAAEWIVAVERAAGATPGLVATVGRLQVAPGAANVVPGEARLSLDVRHAVDAIRREAAECMLAAAREISSRRGLTVESLQLLDQPATAMDRSLSDALEAAAIAAGSRPHRMASGAGHDAMVIAKKVPAAMLFLRSPGGISHHPHETVLLEDVQAALEAGLYFLKHLDATALAFRRI